MMHAPYRRAGARRMGSLPSDRFAILAGNDRGGDVGKFLWRVTIVVHRYLGIAVGALMLMWFASGMVMMYVPYPQLSPAQRLQLLAPMSPAQCCDAAAIGLKTDEPIAAMQVTTELGRLVARIRPEGRPPFEATLEDGAPVVAGATEARAIALDAAPRITGENAKIVSADIVDRDQWTVSEDYELARPLYRFTLDDPQRTQIYVSGNSGDVVLFTTRAGRFWNWLGAVPHWLYFTQLRSDGPLWTKIIIWTSIAGGFLTLVGFYIGVSQFRPGRRISPYRGWNYWHHLAGLVFGVFTLTWVVSGTISMNPWGFLEGGGGGERAALIGDPLPWSAWRDSLARLKDNAALSGAVTITSAPESGRLFWLARWPDGRMLRLDDGGRVAPLAPAELTREAQLVANGRAIASQGLTVAEDSYYYQRPGGDPVILPVYRVVLADAAQTRYYFDPRDGALIGRLDADRRGYRWLFDGLHRLDFFAWLRWRPLWDAVMLLLLAGGIGVTGSGCYLAVRRIGRDARAMVGMRTRSAPPSASLRSARSGGNRPHAARFARPRQNEK